MTFRITIVGIAKSIPANPNITDKNRRETALMYRAVAGDMVSLQNLLDAGANPNAADISQETALIKAVRGRKHRAVQLLLEKGADSDVQDLTGKTALDYALLSRRTRIIRMLEDAGAGAS